MIKTKIVPRPSETDAMGHINNTVIPIWFGAGRREIFKVFSPNLNFKHWSVMLVNMSVDYLNQTYFNEDVQIQTSVKRIGNKSFTLHEELYQNDKLCASGTATYVYIDNTTRESKIIPEEVRNALEFYMEDVDKSTKEV